MNFSQHLSGNAARRFTAYAYTLAVVVLAMLAAALTLHPLVRAFAEVQVNYNEGWNLYWQNRVAQGLPLYAGHPETMFCNYPPLSFYLIGALGAMGINMLVAARLISLFALGICTWACGTTVRRFGGTSAEAVLAGAALLLPLLVFYDDYVGANDPQLLGMALALGALAIHVGGGGASARRMSAVVALLVAAVFVKHNLVALPAAIALDTLWRGDRRVRLTFAASGLTLGLVSLGLVYAIDGPAFLPALLAPREWSAGRALDYIVEMLLRHQAALLLAGVGLVFMRRAGALLIGLYLIFSLLIAGYFSGGAGTAENIWFDMLAALAISAGMVTAALRHTFRSPWLPMAAAVTACAASLISLPRAAQSAASSLGGGLTAQQHSFVADVAFVRDRPGPVLCESLLLCLRAGKAPEIDPFNTYQATRNGRLPPDTLTGMIAARRFATIQIRSPRGGEADRFRNFSLETYDAVGQNYRPLRTSRMGTFSVPAR